MDGREAIDSQLEMLQRLGRKVVHRRRHLQDALGLQNSSGKHVDESHRRDSRAMWASQMLRGSSISSGGDNDESMTEGSLRGNKRRRQVDRQAAPVMRTHLAWNLDDIARPSSFSSSSHHSRSRIEESPVGASHTGKHRHRTHHRAIHQGRLHRTPIRDINSTRARRNTRMDSREESSHHGEHGSTRRWWDVMSDQLLDYCTDGNDYQWIGWIITNVTKRPIDDGGARPTKGTTPMHSRVHKDSALIGIKLGAKQDSRSAAKHIFACHKQNIRHTVADGARPSSVLPVAGVVLYSPKFQRAIAYYIYYGDKAHTIRGARVRNVVCKKLSSLLHCTPRQAITFKWPVIALPSTSQRSKR